MARESERKFLVAGDAWRACVGEVVTITQFYVFAEPDRSARVRVRGDGKASITIKFGDQGRHREEFEYSVPIGDAAEMRTFATGRVIEKTRHHVSWRGYVYEVDVFEGDLAGLVVVELETPDEVADADLPPWLGREVTGDSTYYNSSLALYGRPEP
ncbi:MAG: CYTH domain-containing protein [Rhizobiaceae bacterium]|nr:MAG: CYTH domain-containing protein [Rhizobiaceae bacterium]CAG1008857.1 Inorganic triphosphatase [Rhizobiaceae bacterium]